MPRVRLTSKTILVAFIISLVWLALVVSAPFMVPAGTLTDLSGRVGTRENTEALSGLSPLPRAIYTFGDIECHQIAERSYFLNGNQMPFCARDFGLFLGLVAGFAFALFVRFRGSPLLLLLGLVPMGVDGGLQIVTDYESTNPLRLATGLLAGAVLSMLLALYINAFEDIGKERRRGREGRVGESQIPTRTQDPRTRDA